MLQVLKIRRFCPTWTLCISNESWKHSTFKFDIENKIFLEKICKNMILKTFCCIFDSNSFYNKFYFLMSNLNAECFQLSFDMLTYCPCRTKMMNFPKLWYQKLENFCSQSRLLWRHLTTKLCNLGRCSKALEVDKDASFHLRLCLVDLDKV